MSFSEIYLKTLEELLSQMKDLYLNNTVEITALEHAINYIKLENKKNVLEIKGFDNLIEILKDIDNIINIMIKRSL